MSEYTYVHDYKTDDFLRKSFNDLAKNTFNIDFENWFQKGFWDNTYVCHSFADNGRIISNVSVSKMQVLLNGKNAPAIQIGTVMTHPDYRNQGLAKSLMKRVLEQYRIKYDLFYLFPNESVMEFYPKYGFELLHDYLYTAEISLSCKKNWKYRKLNVSKDEDIEVLQRVLSKRVPRSIKFDCIDSQSVFMWYCLNAFKDNLYVIDSGDIVIVCEIIDNRFELYDIVAPYKIELGSVLGGFTDSSVANVTIHFTPEFSDIQADMLSCKKNEDMFVMPVRCFENLSFAHPVMAHT